jgi:hypothetical protein
MTRTGTRWLRLIAGVALAAVPVVVTLPRWDALISNHPAYPISLAASFALGVLLIVTAVRSANAPSSGAVRTTLRVAGAAAAVGTAALLYWFAPFTAEPVALTALDSDDAVTVTDTKTSSTYEPTDASTATFVFYPGARVDPRAYAVLARGVAEAGSRVVVLKCPFDTAFFCSDPTRDLAGSPTFVVGGHSLGGVSASSFAATGPDVGGVVFWASYPLDDLSGSNFAVTSIFGTNDGLSTPDDIDARRDLLPATTDFVEVDGAIHAFFGDYGQQPGDGEPGIDRADAQAQIISATTDALEAVPTSD